MNEQTLKQGMAQRSRQRITRAAQVAVIAMLPLAIAIAAAVPPVSVGPKAVAAGDENQAMSADTLSDAQIVGIVLAADQIDVDYGKIALARSKNQTVRGFAERMIADHGAVQNSVIALAKKLGVRGAESPVSKNLQQGAIGITAKLKSLRGKEFDEFYIGNEVDYHKVVTDAVAGALIPNAKNAELRAALEGAQPLFLRHLEHARKVQAEISGGMMGPGH